ncbi:MAG: extracellular solute-binding protein, partial [Bacilli bacterium]|nr:extracellular solute-binding protein [Bacilli bacterium]
MNFIRRNKKLTRFIVFTIIILVIVLLLALNDKGISAHPQIVKTAPSVQTNYYDEYLLSFNQKFENQDEEILILASDFILSEGEEVNDNYYEWLKSGSIKIPVDIKKEGLYQIYFRYESLSSSHVSIGLTVSINGELPYYEASQIGLDTLWEEANQEVGVDRYGNDVSILQKVYQKWQYLPLKDAANLYSEGLQFYLPEKENEIEINKISGELRISEVLIQAIPKTPSYGEYLDLNAIEEFTFLKRYEAEQTEYKNSSSINRGVSRDVGVLPFSNTKLKLNVIGVDSYQLPGEAITWVPELEKAGYYNLTFKANLTRQNTTSYRSLYINGEIPFQEARHLAFSYSGNWQNLTLSSIEKEPYLFYLEPGDEITLAVDSSLFVNVSKRVQQLTKEMTELGLDVIKLTRNNIDKNIDWDMLEYFPDLPELLIYWQEEMEELINILRELYGFERDSQIIQDIKSAQGKIYSLSEELDELPRRLGLLSTGPSSAVQLLSSQIDLILQQPMVIDSYYVHSADVKLPRAEASVWSKLWTSIARFFLSFVDQSYTEKAEDDELEVWVNRSRQYVDLIQRVTDDVFTKKTGIKVKVSLMSDDGKLLLANSANQQPDVALGVSAWIPNEYGMRGMLYNLTKAEDFTLALESYHPEQLVPMIYDKGLYGLPETENFYVLFYRKDILSRLDLEVPETWNQVIEMLPVLERYGMSFYIPLSSSSSFKSWDMTSPFIYQYEGDIYSEDGFQAAVNDENTIAALTFVTDLYREYSIPYQVTSFFNNFRYGTIPIGIADFGTYLQLLNTASEIRGLWDIALVPGVEIIGYNEETGLEEEYINRM